MVTVVDVPPEPPVVLGSIQQTYRQPEKIYIRVCSIANSGNLVDIGTLENLAGRRHGLK